MCLRVFQNQVRSIRKTDIFHRLRENKNIRAPMWTLNALCDMEDSIIGIWMFSSNSATVVTEIWSNL